MPTIKGMSGATFARACWAGLRPVPRLRHLFVCVADHFEPEWNGASELLKRERVARWTDGYARSVAGVADSRGRSPQHTFFYPMECYQPELVEPLAELARQGLGDVEVHLHHDNDSSEGLKSFLLDAAETLSNKHGLLTRDSNGLLRYGFIHGNWALDNSHPDGCWCGVNDELTVLRETGCYADFTMPAAPHPAQTRTINSIYDAVDDPSAPKSHDVGYPLTIGCDRPADGLMMIQGPLVIARKGWCQKPKIENGDLTGSQPPSTTRIHDWLRAGIKVRGRSDWLFVKLHTHGAQETNTAVLLGDAMREMHNGLAASSQRRGYAYHYVTAREMAQLAVQAQRGFVDPDFESLSW
ncbi:hypothetical protein [Neorhodopirellula lusitana]|uniref:hypothetical protein n=1 Tax=Neorhodopirellula lusitana TaxID=445327 RepID=UPI00384D90C1